MIVLTYAGLVVMIVVEGNLGNLRAGVRLDIPLRPVKASFDLLS